MFEKCGLRDIFCGFIRAKWTLLAAVLVFACIGGGLYYKDYKVAQAKTQTETNDTKVYAGYAYYYLSGENGEILSASNQKRYVKSYIDLMTAIPSREAILNQLLENHDSEELKNLLDPVLYANGVTRNPLWEGSYYVERWSSDNIIRIKAVAQTNEMCVELLNACKDRLEEIANSTNDTAIAFEGEYTKKVKAGEVILSDRQETKTEKAPSSSKILLFALIGLFIGLLLSLIRSILFPVLNRASDFELYGVKPLGEVQKKTAPLLARILSQIEKEDGKRIVFVTGKKNAGKIKEFLVALSGELNRLGRSVALKGEENIEGKTVLYLGASPDKDAAESDLCANADLVIIAEEKGKSLHNRLDEMKHYLELLGIEIKGAILID